LFVVQKGTGYVVGTIEDGQAYNTQMFSDELEAILIPGSLE